MSKKETDKPIDNVLTKVESILPAVPNPAEFKEIFAENCEGITPTFQTITIPAAGGLAFNLTKEDGEETAVTELEAVILDHYPVRTYWSKAMSDGGGGTPPDCSSMDGVMGSLPRNEHGEFGACSTCKLSKYVEEEGRSACNLKHRVFILQKDQESIFPSILQIPTMSLKNYEGSFPTYTIKMAGRMKRLSGIISKIKLTTATNKKNIKYSKALFFYGGDLSDQDKAKVEALRTALKSAMRQKPIEEPDAGDVVAGSNGSIVREPWDEG